MSGKTIASLQAVIGADVSAFERGASQVKSTLGSLSGDMKKLNQSAGMFPGDKLGADFQNYVNGLNRAVPVTRTFGQAAGDAWAKYTNFSRTLATNIALFSATAVGVGYAGKQIYQFAKSGAELEYTKMRFDRLAESVGTTGDVFMNRLRVATKGTVSDMQLAKNGADLFQLGLARTADEAVRLSKVQTALGMDTGELTLALANQSKRRLDQLGLSLTKFNEIEKKLKEQGLSKEDAFREAFLQTAEQTVVITGNKADTQAGDFQRLEAGAMNLWNTVKTSAPSAGMGWMFGGDSVSETAKKVGMFMNGMASLMAGNTVWDFSGGLGADSWVRAAGAQDKSSLWSKQGTSRFVSGGMGGTKETFDAITGLSALQSYTAMAYKYGGPGGGPQQGPEITPPDYAAMTEGGMKLTQVNEQYTQSLDELNVKLAEQQALMDKYAKYGETSKKYKEAKENADGLKTSISDLEASQDQQGAAFMLSLLQQQEGTEQLQYDFAAASGLITKGAADQYKAIDKVSKAFQDQNINAEQATELINAISGNIAALNGYSAQTYIDIYIRTHGEFVSQDAATQTMINNPAADVMGSYLLHGMAGGGKLSGSEATLVGDMPGGIPTAYSEIILPDGTVLDAKTSRMLLDSKVFGDIRSAAGGVSASGSVGGRNPGRGGAGLIRRPTGGAFYRPSVSVDQPAMTSDIATVQESVMTLSQQVQQLRQETKVQDITTTNAVALDQSTIRKLGSEFKKAVKTID